MRSEISGSTLPVLTLTLEAGETILAETDRLSWMTPNVALNTTTAAGGASSLFGVLGRALSGGGLFLARLSGPGKVWLQSLTPSKLAHVLAPYLPRGEHR